MKFNAGVLAAPHRVMFLGGTVQALLAMVFWSAQTGGHYAGLWDMPVLPLLTIVPGAAVHSLLMGCGVFPWFVFGFILTAGPRWQGAGEFGRRDILLPALLFAAGWAIIWLALFQPPLLAVGIVVALAGWLQVLRLLLRIARHPAQSREHIMYVVIAGGFGCAGLGAFLVSALGGDFAWLRVAVALTMWGFLLPVFASVSHRMLPFFSAAVSRDYIVRRPAWALRVVLGASVGHGLLFVVELPDLYWISDLPGMLAAASLSRVWWHRDVPGNRLVSVLHFAFAWLALSFALSALQPWIPGIGVQAPLHALTLGYFASMLIGMVSRVTLGHSGRPVMADATMWAAFRLLQATAVVRVLSELAVPGAAYLLWLSSLGWLAAFALWAARYAPLLWRPRIDGKPG